MPQSPSYFLEDCNAGQGAPAQMCQQASHAVQALKAKSKNSVERIQHAICLGKEGFGSLIDKIQETYIQVIYKVII